MAKIDEHTTTRLKALWKSGRDKYRSLFVVLEDTQKEVGHRALSQWCLNNLGMSLKSILLAKGFLTPAEQERVKATFADALQIEQNQRAADLQARVNADVAQMREDDALKQATGHKTVVGAQRAALKAANKRIAELEAALARAPRGTAPRAGAAKPKGGASRAGAASQARAGAGRPLAATEAQIAEVRKLRKAGGSLRDIASQTGLGLQTVRTILA